MNPLVGLGQAWRWSVRKILGLWVRATIKPEDAVEAIAARPRPVCYVLERESHTDFAVLNNVCAQHNLPRPTRRLMMGGDELACDASGEPGPTWGWVSLPGRLLLSDRGELQNALGRGGGLTVQLLARRRPRRDAVSIAVTWFAASWEQSL